jgi:hypothetical protein
MCKLYSDDRKFWSQDAINQFALVAVVVYPKSADEGTNQKLESDIVLIPVAKDRAKSVLQALYGRPIFFTCNAT